MFRPSDRRRLLRGITRLTSYRSLVSMTRVFVEPLGALRRYVDSSHGTYPWRTHLRTPAGRIGVELPHSHDVRTVNEVFCRRDYGSGTPEVVVDIGANIGLASLYFLSRNPDARVYACEPVATNLERLRANVAPFEDRVVIEERAVSPEGGRAEFLVEEVGRYSGLAAYYEHDLERRSVEVDTVSIADLLDRILSVEQRIDLLKIDTEGSEPALVAAVRPDQWERIAEVRYEQDGEVRTRV
ncbi:FkbM family methyltransferase [Phycicoccus avicenniae]|uniref:FkbM family methyltransferase n=1 Tax=Phycicoccus avicenniae TaxID=2828860 RepID=UPI003D266373